MRTISILPESHDSYRALSGDKESAGRTAGEALDALSALLADEPVGTLVIVQNHEADEFFSAARQERLTELMRLREAGSLTAEEERELESLIEVELHGARQRAEVIADVNSYAGESVGDRPDLVEGKDRLLAKPRHRAGARQPASTDSGSEKSRKVLGAPDDRTA